MAKKPNVIISISVLLAVVFITVNQLTKDKSAHAAEEIVAESTTEPRKNQIFTDIESNENIPKINNEASVAADEKTGKLPLTAHEAHQIELWYEAHGYFDEQSLNEYKQYEKDALTRLAESGDLKAIQVLAVDAIMRGDYEAAHFLYLDAAAFGSTKALIEASWLTENAYVNSASDEDKTMLLTETLALQEVALKRGDTIDAGRSISRFKNFREVEPRPEQSAAIVQRANEIYLALENKRVEIGLDEFDNSVSSYMQKFADLSSQ